MPRTWRAGGIIGPTTAKQNAGAGGVEVWSLERYELEKQKELLVILMKKLERYELEKQKKLLIILKKTLPYWKNWKKTERLQHSPERAELLIILLKKEPEVLEKLIKLVEKWTELLITPPEETGLYLIEPEELEKF